MSPLISKSWNDEVIAPKAPRSLTPRLFTLLHVDLQSANSLLKTLGNSDPALVNSVSSRKFSP